MTSLAAKRLLISGSSGFLGVHCLPMLLEHGFEVHAATRREPASPVGGVTYHVADLLDPSRQRELIAALRPTHLMHLAWFSKPGGGIYAADENYDWLRASVSLAQTFADHGGARLMVCGSSAEYDWNHGYCTERLTPTVPDTAYGACKLALHVALQAMAKSRRLSWAWPRVFFCYGPHEPPERFVPSVISSLLRNEPALCSHGRQIRDYLHVGDVARGLVGLLDSNVEGPVNISSGHATTLRDIAQSIGELLGRPELVRLGALPARSNDHPLVIGNSQRLQAEVGWQQQISLVDGLRETIEWWRAQLAASAK
jgi:nucleoside-diphosphate-sugar epimerase